MPYKDQERREEMAAAQGGICTYCKRPFPEDLADTAVDHIILRCRGGPDVPWNFCLLHRMCNYAKGRDLTPEGIALAIRRRIILHEPRRPGGPLGGVAERPAEPDNAARYEKYLEQLREAAVTGDEARELIAAAAQALRPDTP